ncbi:MAG TPA: hypothetical protein VF457_15750 [Burkholderiaceae bacterium]
MSRIQMLALGCAFAVSLTGCAGVLRPVRDAISPPGQMNADGSINPCHGFRSDPQACGNALYNAGRIGKVAVGQTMEQVRAEMGREPEQRKRRLTSGKDEESWIFLTDYENSIVTRIEFVDSRVVEVIQESA